MTAPAPTAAPEATRSPASGASPSAVRRVRGVALWVVAVVLGGVLIALAAGSSPPDDYLHPDGTGQGGTRALVEVLRDQGIDVEVAGTAQEAIDAAGDGSGTTVVVGNSSLLGSTAARRLLASTRGADRVVFLDGAPDVLPELDLGVTATRSGDEVSAADCRVPWVQDGDTVARWSWVFGPSGDRLPAGSVGCYPAAPDGPGSPRLWAAVDLPASPAHAPVTLVGFPDAATNRFVTEADHAGLVVRLLGASPRLVWYHPTADDLTENPTPADEGAVWPSWLGLVVWLGALAFLAFAVARGRRLGRLVPEPLPVVVRATETTESRAELYRAARADARAAAVLRHATRTRLAARLGLPPGGGLPELVAAVSDATGVPATELDALLRDAPPQDEAALVRTAQQLAHLEEKVRTP
ncbi:DUF4350 domain-containing protein [Phycicoccus flavus]|uniref:DUF4350 domain-containing protein n=1 Tax=Phycicoccus flavus TaxID=2502783 RepID=UPI000FEB9A3D|nr:DUF4350 domain-containing protein [Phycicoccus flavus]NHA66714.1 DUF4350 domain-containing protein [Phycicoccus flavus]